jgi:uncharacterized membrane protein YhfC
MYGAGHCGIEVFYILVFSMVSNIVMSVMLNAGMAENLTAGVTDEAKLQTLYTIFATLAGTAPVAFLMSIVERIAAVVLHISLSVLVWFAVKKGGKCLWFYPIAVLLHATVNSVAVILSKYVPSVWIVLAAIYVMSACCVLIAVMVWKKYSSKSGVNAIIGTDGS